MNTITLLNGIKNMLKAEFDKSNLKYNSEITPDTKISAPKIFIGSLPSINQDSDFPFITIFLPDEVTIENETITYSIDIITGCMHVDRVNDEQGFTDTLSLTERVAWALNIFPIVENMFRKTGRIKWSVDVQPASAHYTLGGLSVTYERETGYIEQSNIYHKEDK